MGLCPVGSRTNKQKAGALRRSPSMKMAKDEAETSLIRSGNGSESLCERAPETPTGCQTQMANKAPPVITQRSTAGTPAAVAAALALYICVFLISKQEAQRRQTELDYCNQDTVELIAQEPTTRRKPANDQQPTSLTTWENLSLALPAANELQRKRIIQQAREAIELFRFHCKSMQLYSYDYQSMIMVANSAGILTIGIVGWYSLQARQAERSWPLALITTSACIFALALVSIKTFGLEENMLHSRSLSQQSRGIARSYATSIANLTFHEGNQTQKIDTRAGLAALLEQMDKSLSLIDKSMFVVSDQLDEKEARLLYQRIVPDKE